MNEKHSWIIVNLHFAILFVLRFGADAVLTWLGILIGIGLVLELILLAMRRKMGDIFDFWAEVLADREDERPWLYHYVFWPGMIGNFLVFGLAGFSCLEHGGQFRNVLYAIPFWWLPFGIMIAGWLIQSAEITISRANRTGSDDS